MLGKKSLHPPLLDPYYLSFISFLKGGVNCTISFGSTASARHFVSPYSRQSLEEKKKWPWDKRSHPCELTYSQGAKKTFQKKDMWQAVQLPIRKNRDSALNAKMQDDRSSLSFNITVHTLNTLGLLCVSSLFKWVQDLSIRDKTPRLQPTNNTNC